MNYGTLERAGHCIASSVIESDGRSPVLRSRAENEVTMLLSHLIDESDRVSEKGALDISQIEP
jgi:hypothetical protein